jgi:hypothetical protein
MIVAMRVDTSFLESPRLEPLSGKGSTTPHSPKVTGKKGAAAAVGSFDIFDGQGGADALEDMSLDDAAAAAKPNVRIVVCGHVDSGKSTLNGHLVFQLGRVTDQEMRRVTKSMPALCCFPSTFVHTVFRRHRSREKKFRLRVPHGQRGRRTAARWGCVDAAFLCVTCMCEYVCRRDSRCWACAVRDAQPTGDKLLSI